MTIRQSTKRIKGEPSASKRTPCLLLDLGPEIMSNILSFLQLKDGLQVARTCRQPHKEETSNLVFRYCRVVCESSSFDDIEMYHRRAWNKYWMIQKRILCNPVSLGNLRAVLCNETADDFVRWFLPRMVKNSATVNAQAISILLQDSRCQTCWMMH